MTRAALRPIRALLGTFDRDIERIGSDLLFTDSSITKSQRIEEFGQWLHYFSLVELLEAKRVDCVLDVGANDGGFAAGLRAGGWRGRIVSFEPQSACHATLRERFNGDEQWTLLACGLSEADIKADLRLRVGGALASLSPARETGALADIPELKSHMEEKGTEQIQLRRLDTLLSELPGLPVERGFLKVDTQGHDAAVLRGAEAVLDCFVGIQTELTQEGLYEDSVQWLDQIVWLREHGFGLNAVFPILHHPVSRLLIEFDGVFVRTAPPTGSPKSV